MGGGAKGRGTVMSHPFQEGVGTVMSHPFQRGLGDRAESPFPKRGGGGVMSHTKGACPKGVGGLHQSQPRGGGGGANYVTDSLIVADMIIVKR